MSKCDGWPVFDYEINALGDSSAARAIPGLTFNQNGTFVLPFNQTVGIRRADKRLADDWDICIASGRQAHMMRKKCCRHTVKRRYWETYKLRIQVLHRDFDRLNAINAKKAHFKPEFLESMHLINALDLQINAIKKANVSPEFLDTSFQK